MDRKKDKEKGFTPTPMQIGVGSRSERGFTLVETLIAIAILVVAVLAPLAIAQSGLQGARYAQDQMTAVFLAQEAIEIVKSQVYSNMNDSVDWLTGLKYGAMNCDGNECEVAGPRPADQSGGLPIQHCNGSAGRCKVYLDTTSNLYTAYNTPGGVLIPTKFGREIDLKVITAGQEAKITVMVTWTAQDGVTKTYTLSDYITKWY